MAKIDPERTLDPTHHGALLTTLNQVSSATDDRLATFLKLLEHELEPAIKELSTCLLYPDTSITELGQSMDKLAVAMRTMRDLQASLHKHLEYIRAEGPKLVKS